MDKKQTRMKRALKLRSKNKKVKVQLDYQSTKLHSIFMLRLLVKMEVQLHWQVRLPPRQKLKLSLKNTGNIKGCS